MKTAPLTILRKARLRHVVAASDGKLRLAVLSNQNVRLDDGHDVFGETRAFPISNGIVRAEGGTSNAVLLPHGKMLPGKGLFEGIRCLKLNVTQGLLILEKEKAWPGP